MPHDDAPTAVSGEGHPPYEEEFRAIGSVLERDAAQIMERWLERADQEQVHASRETRAAAMDDLLRMLQTLGNRLRQQTARALQLCDKLAREHGQQRSGLGWDVVDLVRDYEILQGVVLEHLGAVLHEQLTYRQAMVIATVVNAATGQAVAEYTRMANDRLEEQIKQQQVDLAQLTLDLTEAEHHQRQQIAQILHDDFQQVVVAARMKLDLAAKGGDAAIAAVNDARDMLGRLLKISREVTSDLDPTVVERGSLADAIAWLAESFQQRFGIEVEVQSESSSTEVTAPVSLRRLVFDAVRELLFNVVKHAQTDRVWIRIFREESRWRIEIEDRGVGNSELANAGESRAGGYGMRNLRARVSHVGGTTTVASTPGEGTRVTLTVPMHPIQGRERGEA